jgi:hypothetical protein
MELKDKVDSLYVATCGNRITAVGTLLYANMVYSFVNHDDLWLNIVSSCGGAIGGYLVGITVAGISTWKHYKRTLKEAKKNKEIEPTFFEERIKKMNKKYIGYCQTQGLYLGAKKTGNLETFYEAKKEFSNNIIPNF